MRLTLLQFAAAFGIGGSLVAVAVPAFWRNLAASRLSEAVDNLATISEHAVTYSGRQAENESFPPSVGLTPEEVPRGVRVRDKEGTWDHLTWRALDFRIDDEHAFSYQFDSVYDPVGRTMRFAVTAHGDLDGDGDRSTFKVFGERKGRETAHVLPGLYVDQQVE